MLRIEPRLSHILSILRVEVAGDVLGDQRIVSDSQFSSATMGLDSGLQTCMVVSVEPSGWP